jgi:FtsZ-binding cell division protein ZapB
MTPEELASHIRDLVARHRISQRELEFLKRDRERLKQQLAERPDAKDVEELQARLQTLEREHKALLKRNRVLNGGM